MRLDAFLKAVGLVKTRMTGKRLCDNGHILLDGKNVKPSHEVVPGACLELEYPERVLKARVIAIPSTRNVSRADRATYIQVSDQPEDLKTL